MTIKSNIFRSVRVHNLKITQLIPAVLTVTILLLGTLTQISFVGLSIVSAQTTTAANQSSKTGPHSEPFEPPTPQLSAENTLNVKKVLQQIKPVH